MNSIVTMRIPCPEIQVIVDKALGKLERARAINVDIDKKGCSVRTNHCLLTINH